MSCVNSNFMDIDYTYTVNLQLNSNAKYTLRFLYRKCQYRISDGYKFTHYNKNYM